jgi:opacity protein-like surface antigen
MKKIILSLLIAFGFTSQIHAQDFSKNALGLRLGDNDGFGGEISYQRGLNDNNRLEFDLGWRNSNNVSAYKLIGLYQWVWEIDNGFNWYAGAGAGIGSWKYDKYGATDSGTIVIVGGDVGVEYNFDIPLQLSLDIRPEFYLNSDKYRDDNSAFDIGLGIRYKFD